MATTYNNFSDTTPDIKVNVGNTFGFDADFEVPAFADSNEYVPAIDEAYCFDRSTTLSILAGFSNNRRVMVQGLHGSGKSTHIEQVAARLNLLGKDAIVIEKDKQVTKFQEGILPWAIQNPTALVFDEYDAGRPDVMFVIQRVLEVDGKLTLLDQNRVLTPNPFFRLFATANTVGLGDSTGLYHGTQQINQGQMDRWQIVSCLNYLSVDLETKVVLSKVPELNNKKGTEVVKNMIELANLTREGFKNGDISNLMSPRTVISWAENYQIFSDLASSFELSFLNKCDETEKSIISEYLQRCFDIEIDDSISNLVDQD